MADHHSAPPPHTPPGHGTHPPAGPPAPAPGAPPPPQPVGGRPWIAPYFPISEQYGDFLTATPGDRIWWSANGSAYWKQPLEPGPAEGYAIDAESYRADLPKVLADGRPVIIGDTDLELTAWALTWDRVSAIYLKDEMPGADDVDASARDMAQRFLRRGLAPKPLLANQTANVLRRGFPTAPSVIPVIEGFILDAPQTVEGATAALWALLEDLVPRAGERSVALSCLTMDRNGQWQDEDSLVAIQAVYRAACARWDTIVGLMPFNMGRPDGMIGHPRLLRAWQDIAAAP